jgi:hypothetical protein
MNQENKQQNHTAHGIQPWTAAVRGEFAASGPPLLEAFAAPGCGVEVRQGTDSLWVVLRSDGGGGLALRAAYSPGTPLAVECLPAPGETVREYGVQGAVGRFHVRLEALDPDTPLLRCTVRLTPSDDLALAFWPRDLFPLGAGGDPTAAGGVVHAAQRGLNTGLVFLSQTEPKFGSLLYVQNLTALNDYCLATGTRPDGCVGGAWPELGYQPPAGDKPLPKDTEIVMSDALLHWSDEVPQDPRRAARLYLDLLAGVYPHLDPPPAEFHDWPRRAEETLRDIEHSPDATITHYGNLYLHPYVAAEYPDSMVQLTTLMPMREYAHWTGKPLALADKLRKGLKRFYDPELGTLRRYLPNVGDDKDADEVDSWYLYHPLFNLGRLALEEGDAGARDLLLRSVDYGIKVARHFHYIWPVQFNVRTLDIITGPRKPGDPGQSDTGGLYAGVMMQAWELTGEDRYLEEAKKALRAVKDMLFELEYQANITAWGATACLRVWEATGDAYFLDQIYVFLASFFHNSLLWQSRLGAAKHYPIFLGVTCLHDGPYMALYECFEAFCSFHEYLTRAGSDLPDSVRLLLTEFCKYTPSRAWYYYPGELPEAAIATEVRNGHIDRKLAFPLEDLYADGQPAGQVGQEIYGCGAAFAFTTRSYHRLKNAPFLLYCEYPIFALEEPEGPCVSFHVRGVAGFSCRARLIPTGRRTLPPVTLSSGGITIHAGKTREGHWEFEAPADRPVEVRWGV